jgi:hypothetical protein
MKRLVDEWMDDWTNGRMGAWMDGKWMDDGEE